MEESEDESDPEFCPNSSMSEDESEDSSNDNSKQYSYFILGLWESIEIKIQGLGFKC